MIFINLDEIINAVDMENIYLHIKNLEGVRHALDTPDKLNEAADYIKSQMEKLGINVREQQFKLNGYDDTFRNIEGWVGNGGPSAVLVAHYDTVASSPGANDDAAGIAVILEVARILSKVENPPNVRFLGVTLEESDGNPILEQKMRALYKKYGVKDENLRWTSANISLIMQKYSQIFSDLTFSQGKSYNEALSIAFSKLENEMPENLKGYLREYRDIFADYTPVTRIGGLSRIGSSRWVDEALEFGKEISYYICLDEIGTTFTQEHSQTMPPVFLNMIESYNVDLKKMIANFEMITTNSEENNVARAFLKHSQRENIDLPYLYINLNMTFDQVVQHMPKALSSDHAPFMRAGFPGIFLFDTSTLRRTYIHSPGDTIDRLDFVLIEKICKAIVATTLEPNI